MAERASEECGSEYGLGAEREGEDVSAVEFFQEDDIQLIATDETSDEAGEEEAECLGAEVKAIHKEKG